MTSLTTVLVTGGAGFVGSQVTAELLRRGRAVRVLANFFIGSRANLAAVGGEVELRRRRHPQLRAHPRRHAGRLLA